MQKTIAIDFDGTLVEIDWPNVGKPLPGAIEAIKQLHADGHKLILNTCRTDFMLYDAENFLKKHNIRHLFLCINKNDPALIREYGVDCRKISADIYIDDKGLGTPTVDGFVDWPEVMKLVDQMDSKP